MSAKGPSKKTTGAKRRIPGKVILPVAVFAVAAALSAVVASLVTGGDPTADEPIAGQRVPAAILRMPPPAPASLAEISEDAAAPDPLAAAPAETLTSTLPPAQTSEAPVVSDVSADAAPTDPASSSQLANLPVAPVALPSGSDPDLVERSTQGLLPKIAPDGRQPWRVYARPFDTTDNRPRLAVVFTSLGLSSAATEAAIQGLPGGVTLAFQPYADDLQQWIQLARAAGHEVLLNLPMEPADYPSSDPGPQALFTALTPEQNLSRLDWALSRVTGYVGVTNFMGSRFTTSREAMLPVVQVLKDRGLLLLDSRASARSVATKLATELAVPRAINDRFLDTGEVTRVSIDSRLAEAERIALEVGTSVVIGQPYPVTIERVRAWAQDLESRGIALAPLSAVVDLQEDR